MEPAELAKIIFSKVQSVDPDNVCKIVGCILLREPDEDDMVHLAYGTEASLHNTIREAKNTLTAIYARCSASPVVGYHHQQVCSHPAAVRHFPPAAAYGVQYWDSPPHAAAEKEYAFVDAETHYGLRGGGHVDDHLDGGAYYFPQDAFHNGAAGPRAMAGRRSNSNGVSSRRPCHYFFFLNGNNGGRGSPPELFVLKRPKPNQVHEVFTPRWGRRQSYKRGQGGRDAHQATSGAQSSRGGARDNHNIRCCPAIAKSSEVGVCTPSNTRRFRVFQMIQRRRAVAVIRRGSGHDRCCSEKMATTSSSGQAGKMGTPVARPQTALSLGHATNRCYFFKGVCKNGQNCHYSHHQVYSADGSFAVDLHGGTTPGSLERLEVEITELLHSRRGQPVSIASLPTLYGEKYGKGLQADGYLTESQRHGKAGYSLTKLLSRLNKIRVIERPHGQHSVVLAEDAAKYTDCRSDRGGDLPASSHQIYLTFPSDSNFTEDDVANYFGQYGPVRDVRIPCQDQRMFGFVSFQNPETVTALLMRRNPHFICGSRVLAKAYREKTKCISDRANNNKPTMHCYPPRWIDTDPEFYPEYDSPRLARRQLVEMKRDRQLSLELERRHFAGLHVEPQCAYFDCNIGDVGPFSSQSAAGSKEVGRMDPLDIPDPLDDIVSTSQAPSIKATNNYQDQESNQIELLPESPFASSAPAGNGI